MKEHSKLQHVPKNSSPKRHTPVPPECRQQSSFYFCPVQKGCKVSPEDEESKGRMEESRMKWD
jgi:hypothetical protein